MDENQRQSILQRRQQLRGQLSGILFTKRQEAPKEKENEESDKSKRKAEFNMANYSMTNLNCEELKTSSDQSTTRSVCYSKQAESSDDNSPIKVSMANSVIKRETEILNDDSDFINKDPFENKYEILHKQVLGEGAHAVVKKGICKLDNKKYAIKIVRDGDEEIMASLKKTFQIQKALKHPFINNSTELFINEKTEKMYYVMELCDFPSLKYILNQRKGKGLSEKSAKNLIKMVLDALTYLHRQGVCHRDIKPENILVSHEFTEVKIIDFGIAQKYVSVNQKREIRRVNLCTRTGTLHYKAPQMFDSLDYNQSVDIWALGVTTFEILVGQLPFYSEYQNTVIDLIQKAEVKFENPQWENISISAKDFIKRLLKTNAGQRLTASDALQHPWLWDTSSLVPPGAYLKEKQMIDPKKKDERVFLQTSATDGTTPRCNTDVKNFSNTVLTNSSAAPKFIQIESLNKRLKDKEKAIDIVKELAQEDVHIVKKSVQIGKFRTFKRYGSIEDLQKVDENDNLLIFEQNNVIQKRKHSTENSTQIGESSRVEEEEKQQINSSLLASHSQLQTLSSSRMINFNMSPTISPNGGTNEPQMQDVGKQNFGIISQNIYGDEDNNNILNNNKSNNHNNNNNNNNNYNHNNSNNNNNNHHQNHNTINNTNNDFMIDLSQSQEIQLSTNKDQQKQLVDTNSMFDFLGTFEEQSSDNQCEEEVNIIPQQFQLKKVIHNITVVQENEDEIEN